MLDISSFIYEYNSITQTHSTYQHIIRMKLFINGALPAFVYIYRIISP